MSMVFAWNDEDERWEVFTPGGTLLLWLGGHGEFEETRNPWKPENPCLMQTLGEGETIEISVSDR